jgi:DNA invertase Pin-like site-specific DNA recombinase
MIYGYVRISTPSQNPERQVRNILKEFPNAKFFQEVFTGTKLTARPEFQKLLRRVVKGDTIVFDSVSRMARNADEGVELYLSLFQKGVNLVFLKERMIDTSTYQKAIETAVPLTGTAVDAILKGINEYLRILAAEQIRLAFQQAQKEVDDLHQRTREGIQTARLEGKQIGQRKGSTLNVKKKQPAKEKILKLNKTFGGQFTNKETWEMIGISKQTFYKYKAELVESLNESQEG